MASLRSNVFSLIILQGSNYLIPLLTLPYLTRVLGVEQYGVFGLTLAIAQYFVLFTDYGFNLTATKKIAQNQKDNNYISKVFWNTLLAKIFLCIISITAMLVISRLFNESITVDKLWLASLMVVGAALTPVWFFQGIEELSKVTLFSVTAKLMTLPLFFIFVRSSNDIVAAIVIQSLINFTSGIIALFLIYRMKSVTFSKPNLERIYFTIKEGSSVFIATLTISLYTISTPIILGLVSTVEQVSIFTAADRIKGAILGVFLILGNAFFPRINNMLSESRVEAFKLIKNILISQIILCGIIGLSLYLFANYITLILYGSEFIQVSEVFRAFSILFVFVMTSTVFGNYILLPLGLKKQYMITPMISAAIHIPLCSILGHYYGAVGGALSIVIVEIVTLVILTSILVKKNIIQEVFR
ncbi:flippase [Vibrio breoganii]